MSDSHGKTGAVSDIVDSNLGKAQMFIHLGDGENELGGTTVYVKGGKALLADGTIAASTTNIFAEFRNIISFGVPVRQAVKSCTINPARAIGVDDVTGSIAVGKRADFTVLSSDLKELGCVYIKGKRI